MAAKGCRDKTQINGRTKMWIDKDAKERFRRQRTVGHMWEPIEMKRLLCGPQKCHQVPSRSQRANRLRRMGPGRKVNSAVEQSLVGTAIQTPSYHLRVRYRPRLILLYTQPCQFTEIRPVKNSVQKEDGLFRRPMQLFWPHSARRPMPH
jgi:hypothetical protein